MIKARRAIAGIAAGTIAFLSASSGVAGAAEADLPVRVTATVEDGVIRVGTSFGTQPLAGAWVDTKTGRACAGFSYQVPQCVDLTFDLAVDGSLTGEDIVVIDDDSSDGDIGASAQVGRTPLVGVRYDVVGHRVCAGV